MNVTSSDKWWRWRLNKARKSGYQYGFSLPPHNKKFLSQLRLTSDAWLNHAGHKERGFALGYFDMHYLQNCKIHYLLDDIGKIIAFTNQVPSYNQLDTATIDLLRYYPNTESMAYLLYETINNIGTDNKIKKFDLGFVPFAKASGPLQSIAKTFSAQRFSSKGLEQFKNKFDPEWLPNYLAYDGDIGDLAIIALNLERLMEAS
jgi:phosphatidylglycerol lysyltransferase